MLPVERLIGEEGLSVRDGELRLAMRLPWYRSLPFSTVEVPSLAIDGESVSLEDAAIDYDGARWSLAENGEQVDRFWFVRDSAFLVVPSSPIAAGGVHEVALTVNVNPPYIPGMKRANLHTETLTAAG